MNSFLKTRGFGWPWLCVAFGLTFSAFGRDPFYPLGYKASVEPPKTNTPESVLVVAVLTNCATEAEWEEVAKPFQVTGVMIAGSRQVVYINKTPYPAGEQITAITTTNRHELIGLATTNRFIFEVAVSEERKPLLRRFRHVRSEPMYLPEEEARKRGLFP